MNSPAVQYLQSLVIDDDVRRRLSQLAFSPTGTRRICLHQSPEAALHAMLVESDAGSEYPPHAHTDSDEVSFAVSGTLEILVWKDGLDQAPTSFRLGENVITTFIPKGTIHLTRPIGGNCVYLEVKLGPFRKESTKVYPDKT